MNYRLTREGKSKAEKNRSKVTEAFWKSVHAAKAEKAQVCRITFSRLLGLNEKSFECLHYISELFQQEERERKRREIKDKIREIDDPDRQRRLEEKELRWEMNWRLFLTFQDFQHFGFF